MIDRRRLLAGAGLAAGALGVGGLAAGLLASAPVPVKPTGLRRHAAARGMSFGCMILDRQRAADAPLMRSVCTEADMIVPGIELKWGFNERRRERPDYAAADAIAGFAAANRLKLRGHAGFWYRNVPPWAVAPLAGPDADRLILARVRDVARHFRGRVAEWDVVNEAIEPNDGLPGGMRRAPFAHATDPGWIADCFHAAHEADPAARLFYNDYGLENDWKVDEDRRNAVLALLADLRRRGAPVHGLGLQTHIGVGQRFDAARYRRFLGDVASLRLALRITEFDVNDRQAPADIARRDRAVADRAGELLAVAFDEPAMQGMLCWGLRDKDSYQNSNANDKRADGAAQRSLPLDDMLHRKPLWQAIARAFDAAPVRAPAVAA